MERVVRLGLVSGVSFSSVSIFVAARRLLNSASSVSLLRVALVLKNLLSRDLQDAIVVALSVFSSGKTFFEDLVFSLAVFVVG